VQGCGALAAPTTMLRCSLPQVVAALAMGKGTPDGIRGALRDGNRGEEGSQVMSPPPPQPRDNVSSSRAMAREEVVGMVPVLNGQQ
jgi:hypothetical protein